MRRRSHRDRLLGSRSQRSYATIDASPARILGKGVFLAALKASRDQELRSTPRALRRHCSRADPRMIRRQNNPWRIAIRHLEGRPLIMRATARRRVARRIGRSGTRNRRGTVGGHLGPEVLKLSNTRPKFADRGAKLLLRSIRACGHLAGLTSRVAHARVGHVIRYVRIGARRNDARRSRSCLRPHSGRTDQRRRSIQGAASLRRDFSHGTDPETCDEPAARTSSSYLDRQSFRIDLRSNSTLPEDLGISTHSAPQRYVRESALDVRSRAGSCTRGQRWRASIHPPLPGGRASPALRAANRSSLRRTASMCR